MNKGIRFLVATLVVGAAASRASAVISLEYGTNFNSPTYTDGPLVNTGSATDTTTPGQDGWLNTNAGITNNIAVSNSATNGFVSMTTSGQDVRHPLVDSITSGSVYLDADFNVSAAQATGDYFIHLGDGGLSNFNARTFIKASAPGFVMALGTGAGATPTYGSTVLNFSTTYHMLARYDLVAGAANDTGALYINPTTTDGSGDTPYVLATLQGTDAASISAVYLRQGTAANSATLASVDNIAVTATVPEPASLSILGLAGLVFASRRRSR